MTADSSVSSPGPRREDSSTRSIRVGILGHVGNQNLGDESIIAAVIQNVRRRYPHAEILGFTLQPGDTQARHGIVSHPIRRLSESSWTEPSDVIGSDPGTEVAPNPSLLHRIKEGIKSIPVLSGLALRTQAALEAIPTIIKEVPFLLESRRHVKGLDLLIFAGSHQLNDFVGGPWAYPYTVLKWTLLAKGAGAKVVFMSLGAGPIDSWLGRRFLRRALEEASYRSYRDVTGKGVIDALLPGSGEVVPDLAFSLDSPVAPSGKRSGGRPVVGINAMPLYTDYWHDTNFSKYENYVGKLAAFADGLVDRGRDVHFIPTQLKVDPPVIVDMRNRMASNRKPESQGLVFEPKVHSLSDLRTALANVDIMVATRYHGILLALALQKPVLAIAYHPKSRDLMGWLGLGEYVIDGDEFTAEALAELITSLEKEGPSIVDSLGQQLPKFRAAVQAQYDAVLGLYDA